MHHVRCRRSDSTHRHTLDPGKVAFPTCMPGSAGAGSRSLCDLCASVYVHLSPFHMQLSLGMFWVTSPSRHHFTRGSPLRTSERRVSPRENPDTGTDPCRPWLAVRTGLSYNYCRAIAPLPKWPAPARYGACLVGPWSEQPRQCGEMAGQMTSLGRRIIDLGQELTI